ncbi:hypothetical protein, partial [Nostoc commune]|uniref:hypothetical protein n=1 Tax=Nostoc commune TaxID=1178 RepID=UPI001E37120C
DSGSRKVVPLPTREEGFRVRAKTTVLNIDEVYTLFNYVSAALATQERHYELRVSTYLVNSPRMFDY